MTSNPSVNRYLKDEAFDHIDHALGRPVFPERQSYRNYFATSVDGEKAKAFDASPFWVRSGRSGSMAFYSVTDEGRHALSRHLVDTKDAWRAFVITFEGRGRTIPAKSAASAKYSAYLDIRDWRPDLTFIDFARACSVRLAA